VADSLMLTCPDHHNVLLPDPGDPARLFCPDAACDTSVRVAVPEGAAFPFSPMTSLEQGAAAHHELVRTYESAGFTRTEAMQILCTTITATIMKDRGHG
jgi:hypothetical protein